MNLDSVIDIDICFLGNILYSLKIKLLDISFF